MTSLEWLLLILLACLLVWALRAFFFPRRCGDWSRIETVTVLRARHEREKSRAEALREYPEVFGGE